MFLTEHVHKSGISAWEESAILPPIICTDLSWEGHRALSTARGLGSAARSLSVLKRYPRFREELLKPSRTNPDVEQEPLDSRMESLIVGPLEATQIQTLIIFNAVGECYDISTFISPLFEHTDGTPNVKLFTTGRPVYTIDRPQISPGTPDQTGQSVQVKR